MSELLQTPQEPGTVLAPIEALIGEAASFIGGDDSPRAREAALAALDRAARRMNLSGLYLYNNTSHDYTLTSDPPFVDGARTIELPDDWGWPTDGAVALDENGDLLAYLEWLPWDVFRKYDDASIHSSIPGCLSIENEFTNIAHILPAINANEVTTLSVSYFRRVTKPSEARSGSVLYLPDETLEALLTGAEYFLTRHRNQHNPQRYLPMQREFYNTIMLARAAAARRQSSFHTWARPDEGGYSGYRGVGLRPTFIKL